MSIGLASALLLSSTSLSHVHATNSEQTSTTEIASTNDSSEIVNIPDTYLKEAIAHALNVSPNSDITTGQLESLTYLEAGYVSSLESLQYATHLQELVLYEGEVSDLSPLANLTSLNKLDISANLISDLSPLTNLTNLAHLYVGENNITNLSSLAHLTHLEELYLSNNHISNLSPLAKLTNLHYLYVGENNITNLSPLAHLTHLEVLALGGNHISNISYLSKLTDLLYLSLDRNNLSNISSLAHLTNLEELDVSDNHIVKFSALRPLKNLQYLEQDNNPGEDQVKPKIEGVGNKTIRFNQPFDATLGVKASDNAEGDVTKYLTIEGTVNTKKVGTYSLTYIVADSVGNETKVNSSITVKKDNVKPTLFGVESKTVKRNKPFYAKAGVTAKDNIDRNITKHIQVTGNINIKKAGKYTLTYTVTDTSGNKTTKRRIIIVK